MLWVDTINGNIDRYFDRYFIPALKQLDKSQWDFNQSKRLLKINGSIIDFRSADHPESIEGFGYKKIFLNEAGIILKDDYLYSHAILPMLLDYPDSQLIAGGVPKGITKKDGKQHKFYELKQRADAGEKGFMHLGYTSYDNPLLGRSEIDDMIRQMTPAEAQQEIFGEFVDFAGNNPFAVAYKKEIHESELAVRDDKKQLFVSMDFNINPFSAIFAHKWRDRDGEHIHVFDECEIKNGNIMDMSNLITTKYRNFIPTMLITGDYMGNIRQMAMPDLASLYQQLDRALSKYGFRSGQMKLRPNPTHQNSRADSNYFLAHFPDFKINPTTCPGLCRDMRIVQVDGFGEIVKRNRNDIAQRADLLDCFRMLVHNFANDWISQHQKIRK